MAQRQFLCDHSPHGGANYMSCRHSCRIQDSRRVLGHPFYRIRAARNVASSHATVVKVDSAVMLGQDRQDAKPHIMGETQTHNEEDRGPAALLIPENSCALAGDVRHYPQSSRRVMQRNLRKSTPIYMGVRAAEPQMKWLCYFTLETGQGSIETPPRISRRNGISVC